MIEYESFHQISSTCAIHSVYQRHSPTVCDLGIVFFSFPLPSCFGSDSQLFNSSLCTRISPPPLFFLSFRCLRQRRVRKERGPEGERVEASKDSSPAASPSSPLLQSAFPPDRVQRALFSLQGSPTLARSVELRVSVCRARLLSLSLPRAHTHTHTHTGAHLQAPQSRSLPVCQRVSARA